MASSAPDQPAAPLVERIATRQRLLAAILGAATLACWAWLATRPMEMTPALPSVVFMWFVMMAAMMLPAAAPAVLLHGRVAAHHGGGTGSSAQFASGYLLAWGGFSVLAALAQLAATRAGLVDMMSLRASAAVSPWLWLAAGAYQLTPLKRACLRQCRSPAAFFAHHWRPGTAAALRLGLRHGLFCLGCCAPLMALLFVGGAMNLAWAAALAGVVAVEKIAPRGETLGRAAGVAMIGWGLFALLA